MTKYDRENKGFFLKTFNKNTADYLIKKNFEYVLETINNNDVYCFLNTKDILKIIKEEGISDFFFLGTTLNF